ncbi:MAG: MlaD family protein [Pirellulales bacterium]|nr:MlaD family protein [Pirellulales bacterium]
MDDRVVQFRVGVMVLATLGITAILVVLLGGRPTLGLSTYPIVMNFRQAPGVTADTPVRKSGILIGRVTRTWFADDGSVNVRAEIYSNVKLHGNDRPRITSTLLGDGALEFTVVDDSKLRDPKLKDQIIPPNSIIAGSVTSDPLAVLGNIEGDLTSAITSIARTSDQIGRLAGEVADLVEGNREQFSRVADKLEVTLGSVESAAGGARQVLGDEELQENLRATIKEFPAVLQDFRDTIKQAQQSIASLERNLTNFEGLTRPLGERGEEIVGNIQQASSRFNSLLDELTQFTRSISQSQGSLGMLLNDQDLYHNLNQAAENLNYVLQETRPVLRDVRVVTDRVAREGVLHSELQRRSGVK